MKLKLKAEYLDTTISFRGKEYLLRLAPENMYQHFYKGGFKDYFEETISTDNEGNLKLALEASNQASNEGNLKLALEAQKEINRILGLDNIQVDSTMTSVSKSPKKKTED